MDKKFQKETDNFKSAFLGGICIGFGAIAYLTVQGLAGAVLFALGLIAVNVFKADLFTAKANEYGMPNWTQTTELLSMLGSNIFAICTIALIARYCYPDIVDRSVDIMAQRLHDGWLLGGFKAIGCGAMVSLGVLGVKQYKSFIPLILAITVFVICGWPHCIADPFYFMVALFGGKCAVGYMSIYVAIIVGNYLGCNIHRLAIHVVENNKKEKVQ